MKTAVIYARYSSDSQTEQSIEGQLRVCEEYAAKNNIVVIDTYIDRAMTGTNDNRPDFQRMIRDSAKKTFGYVLVYKFDRFSRNKYETAIHKKALKDNGVRVISATEYIPDSPEAIILESMLEGYAEYYSAELSQKVKRGMNESRRKGNFTGGVVIYGYKVENKKLVVEEDKAEIVRYIFSQYSAGVYVKDIIVALNERGITNRGKPFAKNSVYNILRNEKYAGIYRHGDEIFENIYPAIVDKKTYEKVRSKIEKNRYGKRSTSTVYLLRHKISYGYCGKPISAECGTAKNGKVVRYYKCLGKKNGNGCRKSQVKKEVLEVLVTDSIAEALSSKECVDKIVHALLELQEKQFADDGEEKRIKKEQKRVAMSIDNIMAAIENGGTAASAMKRLRELEARQQDLEKALCIECAKNSFKLTADEIRKFYKQALESEPRMLIDLFVKEIILYDDRMEIIYNTPLKTSPDDERGFSFYDRTTFWFDRQFTIVMYINAGV